MLLLVLGARQVKFLLLVLQAASTVPSDIQLISVSISVTELINLMLANKSLYLNYMYQSLFRQSSGNSGAGFRKLDDINLHELKN